MPWENSKRDTVRPTRATAHEITPTMWVVGYRHADYTVARCADGWKITGRHGLTHIVPDSDLGKEAAIDWIEANC
jgi:hypothetical protein